MIRMMMRDEDVPQPLQVEACENQLFHDAIAAVDDVDVTAAYDGLSASGAPLAWTWAACRPK